MITLVILTLVAGAYAYVSTVINDACYVSAGCDLDPETNMPGPLTIQYYPGESPTYPAFALIDKPLMYEFSALHNTTVNVKLPDETIIRYVFPQLLESSLGPDVLLWESISTFVDNCYPLNELAIEGNWSSRYPPRLMELMTVNGNILAVPDSSAFWGFWYSITMFDRLGITKTPDTWDEFLAICAIIKAAGITPLGYGPTDLWQPLSWWSMLAYRIGGTTWWNGMSDGDYDFTTDTVNNQTWNTIQQLIDLEYFPTPINQTATLGYGDALVNWAIGK